MEEINRRGSILIVALWSLLLLSLTAAAVSFKTRIEVKRTGFQRENARLLQTAKHGVARALFVVESSTVPYFSFGPAWNGNDEMRKEGRTPEGKFTVFREDLPFAGFSDEESRININTAPRVVLKNLFPSAPDAAAAVEDWRDADDDPLPGGAEKEDYRARGAEYSPRNGPFRGPEELLLVKNVTPELYSGIEDSVTVFGSGRVNVNTASSKVLRALGLPESLIEKITSFRSGSDGVVGTEDDGVFKSLVGSRALLDEKSPLTDEESAVWNSFLGNNALATGGEAFRLRLLAETDAGARRIFVVVIAPKISKTKVVYWDEIY